MKFNDFNLESESIIFSSEEFNERLNFAIETSYTYNLISFFKEGIPTITDNLRKYINGFASDKVPEDIGELDHRASKLDRAGFSERYLNYRDVIVQIPEGFIGEFLEYVNTLNSVGVKLIERTNKLITQYQFTIGSVLTNVDQRTSHNDLTNFYKEADAACKELQNHLKVYFDSSLTSRARLITVMPDFRDNKPLITGIKQLSKIVNVKQIAALQTSIRDTVSILDMIEDHVRKSDMTEVTPQVVTNIAKGSESLARYIDQVVVFNYASISIISCVKLLFEKLSELQ